MVMHLCECEGSCICGRPKPRPTNEQLADTGIRWAQLASGQYEGDAPRPTDADIAFVSASDSRHAGLAGRLLGSWMRNGWLADVPPQRVAGGVR